MRTPDAHQAATHPDSTGGEPQVTGRGSAPRRPEIGRGLTIATWIARLCFAFVFAVNVQCALGFALMPEAYMGAYELSGVPGRVGIQGIGIAFLMWNCTYPAFIARPRRFTALGAIILAQQVVGLIGESLIRATLPAGHEILASSIDLFIRYDTLGLVLMGASFAILRATSRRERKERKRR